LLCSYGGKIEESIESLESFSPHNDVQMESKKIGLEILREIQKQNAQ
jgi:hypothetical protein